MFGKEKGNYSIALNEDDIRGGSLSLFEGREVFFDDEIEEAHAEELAAGTSSRDTIHIFDSESDIDSGSYPPSALIRYPVYDGGGDIADGLPADRMGHQYPIPPRYVDAKQLAFSSRQPDPSWLKRDISNATSTLPAGYVEMIGTTRRRRRYLSPERQRCIGGTLSAAGVFVLGFMLVLIGHAWYEKNNPTTEDSSKDADNSIWTVVQTVTYAPMSPSQAPSISADEQSEDDLEYGYENYDTWNGKLSNVSTAEPSEAGFATPPPLQPESLPDVFSRIYRLHHENDPIQVSLNTGQRLYMGRPGCGNSLDENATSSLLVHIPEVTHTISTTAQIGEVSVQLALESDTSFSVCHELSNEPTAVLNYILVPAVNNTNEMPWTETVDFTKTDETMVELIASATASTGIIILAISLEVEWFTWNIPMGQNIFNRSYGSPELGDLCPEKDSAQVQWLSSHYLFPEATLWTVHPERSTIAYGCGESRNVTHSVRVVYGRSTSSEDVDGHSNRTESSSTAPVNGEI